MNRKIVISSLPKAGLGNKLFSWASGLIFSHLNQRKHIVIGLTKLHPRAFFRKDKSKRFYLGYFTNERYFSLLRLKKSKVLLQKDADQIVNWTETAIFNEIPHWSDMFDVIRDHRQLVVAQFWNTLTERIKTRLSQYDAPSISIHVRMGDFRELKEGEDFAKVGSVRTPINYFVNCLTLLREYLGFNMPATVFSDGSAKDLQPLLSLPNVESANDDLDIVHLALMSKSKIIIMSAGSTFGFWAGFLSEAILINHFQHIHQPIRDEATNKFIFEGGLNPKEGVPKALKTSLNSLKRKDS